MKKRLTQAEEFEILKLVLDKFLWLGFGIMAYGFYVLVTGIQTTSRGVLFLFGGALVLILFMFVLMKEYEVVK